LSGGCGGGNEGSQPSPGDDSLIFIEDLIDYSIRQKILVTETVLDSEDTVINVGGENGVSNISVTIPANSLPTGSFVRISASTPPLISDYVYATYPLMIECSQELEPEASVLLEIDYSEESNVVRFIQHPEIVKLFVYKNGIWDEGVIYGIDLKRKIIYGEVKSQGIVALFIPVFVPEEITGRQFVDSARSEPRKGDTILTKNTVFGLPGFFPGHAALYLGKNDKGEHVILEAWPPMYDENGVLYENTNKVRKRALANLEDLAKKKELYLGAFSPRGITDAQREKITEFAEISEGKPYTKFSGFLEGFTAIEFRESLSKGDPGYTCVGLVEAFYEYIGINGGNGMVSESESSFWWANLTVYDMYNALKYFQYIDLFGRPQINSVWMEPQSGPSNIESKLLISVSHTRGLKAIRNVSYRVKETGWFNPNIIINDKGEFADEIANDGIYTGIGCVGSPEPGERGMNLTVKVIDDLGKSVEAETTYWYTGALSSPLKSVENVSSFKR
jgi:hypothetical protein